MANIFKRFTDVVNKPNRATYDLSFQNNLTMKFGTLYPVFCKEVIPGDSFRIKPTFNFNFMPLVSPVQTRMKANLHFFYVRNRPHWKDFMDWDGMTKEGLIPPYLEINETNRDMIETGSIGDFLGLPTRVFGDISEVLINDLLDNNFYNYTSQNYENGVYGNIYTTEYNQIVNNVVVGQNISSFITPRGTGYDYTGWYGYMTYTYKVLGSDLKKYLNKDIRYIFNDPSDRELWLNYVQTNDYLNKYRNILFVTSDDGNIIGEYRANYYEKTKSINFFLSDSVSPESVDGSSLVDSDYYTLVFVLDYNNSSTSITPFVFDLSVVKTTSENLDVKDLDLSQIPWANGEIRINAFPFRHYESIYNSFYRDDRNNPRMVNGQPEYNKFITTDDGGADSTHYKLYQRNWESDFLTTAVQSPQQGVAPLVGITSVNAVGEIQLEDASGNTYTAKTTLADDGDTIVGINITSGNGTASVNRALVDMASTGISISDLRNVNALQRWLEINMRRGLRYRDQVKSHYGVDLEYKELNMPEFIGGVSEDVIVNRISQTVETEDNPLGSLAGQAGVLGTSRHDISHYCDEKGFIIGILSISPVPNYSQLLPKHLLKNSQLDYFTPEFNNVGMQPILNSEVTPLQASLEGKLNDVFGYQRPWYDYLASVDEVHGQFRDTMRRYLINRVFDGTPELGSEFLTIDPEQINDVFAVTSDTDKIYGQIWFDVTAKRPIAANVTPRIEP